MRLEADTEVVEDHESLQAEDDGDPAVNVEVRGWEGDDRVHERLEQLTKPNQKREFEYCEFLAGDEEVVLVGDDGSSVDQVP